MLLATFNWLRAKQTEEKKMGKEEETHLYTKCHDLFSRLNANMSAHHQLSARNQTQTQSKINWHNYYRYFKKNQIQLLLIII